LAESGKDTYNVDANSFTDTLSVEPGKFDLKRVTR
jgi:hypothetical protein